VSGHGELELDRLTKSYGEVQALDGLSFTVPPGQVFGFLGPNGAGTVYERAILRTGGRLKVRQVLRSAA
jgi:ABC-type uncharacterized transport system ATPase subunit